MLPSVGFFLSIFAMWYDAPPFFVQRSVRLQIRFCTASVSARRNRLRTNRLSDVVIARFCTASVSARRNRLRTNRLFCLPWNPSTRSALGVTGIQVSEAFGAGQRKAVTALLLASTRGRWLGALSPGFLFPKECPNLRSGWPLISVGKTGSAWC
jgi:hypothetical protein